VYEMTVSLFYSSQQGVQKRYFGTWIGIEENEKG